jgi:hypothetical protein
VQHKRPGGARTLVLRFLPGEPPEPVTGGRDDMRE